MSLADLTTPQLDALREMASIGGGHAATALSRLIGSGPVEMDVPTASIAPFADVPEMLGGAEAPVVGVLFRIGGGTRWSMLVLFPDASARLLCELLLRRQIPAGALDEVARSALAEVANILASSYLNAIGRAAGVRLLPSVPYFAEDMLGAVAEAALVDVGAHADRTLVLATRFMAPVPNGGGPASPGDGRRPEAGALDDGGRQFIGHFAAFADPRGATTLLKALGL
jgi:chemotaxis protein CheC